MARVLKIGSKAWEREQSRLFEIRCEEEADRVPREISLGIKIEARRIFEGLMLGTESPNSLTPGYICRNYSADKERKYSISALHWIASKEIKRLQETKTLA